MRNYKENNIMCEHFLEPLKWKMKKSNERLGCVTREEEMNGVLRHSVNTKDTQNGDLPRPGLRDQGKT